MASSWCLHERTKLGGEGSEWRLSKEEELRVGTSSESNIRFHSQSVDSQHAVFRWDQKNAAFTLRDLNTVNGTYVNNQPLRGSSMLLKHNDSIRFGYDKDRVFRMEECFYSPKKSSTMASTSCRNSVPVSNHGHMTNTTSTTSETTPPSYSGSDGHTPPLPIRSILPTEREELTGSLSSPHRSDGRRSVDLDNTPALHKASKLYGKPDWWGEAGPEGMAEARQREFEFVKPGSQILRQLDPPEAKRGDPPGPGVGGPKLSSKDELRLQSLSTSLLTSDTPTSWTVDFGGGGGGGGGTLPRRRRIREHGTRPRSADPSPNRLRDSSPCPKRAATPTSAQTRRHASFNVGTPSVTSRKQRSATPPVIRSTGASSRKPPCGDKLNSPKKRSGGHTATTPLSPRHIKPPSSLHHKTTQSRGPKSRPPNSGSVDTRAEPSPSQPPLHTRTPSPPNSPPLPPPSPPPPDSNTTPPATPSPSLPTGGEEGVSKAAGIDLMHLKEGGSMSHLVRDDETYTLLPLESDECHSLSSLSDHTLSTPMLAVAATPDQSAAGGDDEKTSMEAAESPTTPRRNEEETQSPDSLMIANIESRMRRLSRMAHQTARQVTSLRNSIQEGCQVEVRGVDYLSLRDTSPVVTRAEQHLPEWKSFNKEAHSIFRNIRVVEKWLQDIDGTLSSIKPIGSSGNEGVDFASDGEIYMDSMDNVDSSSNSEGP